MTYASTSASFVGRTNAPAIRKPLPVLRTRKRTIRSAGCKSFSYQAQPVVHAREELSGKQAFEEMFLASRPKFVASAYSILRNREDAEDAVQNAFLSGYVHLRSFEGRSALRTWFTRIVLNAALMLQRKRKPLKFQPFPENSDSREVNWTETIPALTPDPEMIHAERETLNRINAILGRMKPALRQAFKLTYFDELSVPEACALLGVSAGTFKARLFRARRRLLDQTKRAAVAPIHQTTFLRLDVGTASKSPVGA